MRLDIKKWLLFAAGTLAWSATMVKSGWLYSFGLGFWGPNGHDGVWHIALAESLARGLPAQAGSWQMPVFAGESLKNYHIGFDLALALINQLTRIPISFLYFQLFPPILAFLVGYLTYKFVFVWRKSKNEALLSTFFVYFGGSWGWVITLLRGQGLGGESMFWSQQAISTLINPPFALSLVLILGGLIFSLKYLDKGTLWYMILAGIFFGLLIEIKIYAGILVLAGLSVTTLIRINVVKRLWKVLAVASAISLVLFFLFNRGSASLIIFRPFWFLETMMGLTDRLGWLKFASAMTNYRLGGVWIKAIPAYLVAFAIFVVGNAGTRIIYLWHLKNLRKFSWVEIFIISLIIFGTLLPMLFLQAGTPWNTIQFFYYSLFFLGILAGISLAGFLQNSNLKTTLIRINVVAVVVLTIPTTVGTLSQVYLPGRPPAMLSNAELSALTFLSKQPVGVVLTYPYDSTKAKEAEANPPRPLYLYESTAYVSAFSNKPTFLEDEVNLDITGYNWRERRREVEDFYTTLDSAKAKDFLKKNNIKYVYWVKPQRANLGEGQLGLTRIFENKEVDIFEFTGE